MNFTMNPNPHVTQVAARVMVVAKGDCSYQVNIRRVGEIDCDDALIPVWSLADGAKAWPGCEGKIVRYSDMPAEILQAFREQQVLAGKPFEGAAYVEDFQLFADLQARNC